jgi:hypothetical protein
MTRAAATVTNAATDMCNAAAATDVSATDVNSAATATRMDAAARMNAAAATSMGTAAAATAVTAAAAAAVTRGNSYGALSCDSLVGGAVADAPPVIAKETPAAPNAKAAFPMFRLEPRFAFAIVEPPCQYC